MRKISKCPVCGSGLADPDKIKVTCRKCGFENVYASMFASEISKQMWEKNIRTAKSNYRQKLMMDLSETESLKVSGNKVAFLSPYSGLLTMIDGFNEITRFENVRHFDCNERNEIVLYNDGKVKANGDNDFGQCNIKITDEAIKVLAAPDCSYLLCKDGTVHAYGAIVNPEIRNWTSIKKLACGSFHVLGLTKNGEVKIAGELIDDKIVEEVFSWRGVKDIAAATDCSLALFNNGQVVFVGRENDRRKEAENWSDIVSIKVDSTYAVGLTGNGEIKLAGKYDEMFDMNRSSSAKWKNILAISCSRSGICAVDESGEIHLAGNFSFDIDKIKDLWEKENVLEN